MNYTNEFKERVFSACKSLDFVNQITKAMDEEQDCMVRHYLEEALDDKELIVNEIIKDDGERIIANAKIKTKQNRQEVYNEFMDLYCHSLGLDVEEAVLEEAKK